jgi:ubiquinone/menaquinone biosynthesis C-methylase UbiE
LPILENKIIREDYNLTLKKGSNKREQEFVTTCFDNSSAIWREIYQQKDVFGTIHQQRQIIALKFVKDLSLPKTTNILEIGCGAGFVTVALAKKGFSVEALDCAPSMIKATREHAKQIGMDNRIHASIGDVHDLAFQDQAFGLVVALGVTPWLNNLEKALLEIDRVLMDGGYVILNADNRYRLNHLLDPLLSPVFESTRKWIIHELLSRGPDEPSDFACPHMYLIKRFDAHLYEANLLNIKSTNLGFGPFTFLKHNIFPDQIGVSIHQKLQKYADKGYPILRSTGAQYIVLARKK